MPRTVELQDDEIAIHEKYLHRMCAKTLKMYEPPELTATEANALMVMLDSEFETMYGSFSEGLDINEWQNLDLDAYRIKAYHKFKTWYHSQFKHKDIFEEKGNDD